MESLLLRVSKTLADIVAGIGGVPLHRVRGFPPLGTATEADVIRERESPERRLCELIDGILVEKAMGSKESILACELIRLLGNHVRSNRLGVILGPDGMLRLFPGLVRIPDVSFIPWTQIPGRRWPDTPIAEIPPTSRSRFSVPATRPARSAGRFANTSSRGLGSSGWSIQRS